MVVNQPFNAITMAAGVSVPFQRVDTSGTFQQSLLILQTALGGGLLTVEVQMAFGAEMVLVDQFIVGAVGVPERRVYNQAGHAMQLRFTAPAPGGQIISGSFGGAG
tara:strand:+ start:941 stop:1258 length:318 start_codon:yes stop_codon:yes gene_type:complete